MRHLRQTIAPLLFGIGLASGPALGFDAASMTDAERTAFRAEVRSFLMENPEVLVEAFNELESRQAAQQNADDQALIATNAEAILNDGYSWTGGNPEGDLTIVEFIDYRCGYCRKAHAEVAQLVEGDGNLRYVVKEFPILGEESVTASRFAIATLQIAGDAAYAKVNDGFYTDFRGDYTTETLTAFAERLDLDPAPILAHMDSDDVTRVITENHSLGQRLRISGTPTFVLGDTMLRGYLPLEAMQDVVAEERG